MLEPNVQNKKLENGTADHGEMTIEWLATIRCATCGKTDTVDGDSEALTLESFGNLARWRFAAKGWVLGLAAARTTQGRILCPDCQ